MTIIVNNNIEMLARLLFHVGVVNTNKYVNKFIKRHGRERIIIIYCSSKSDINSE